MTHGLHNTWRTQPDRNTHGLHNTWRTQPDRNQEPLAHCVSIQSAGRSRMNRTSTVYSPDQDGENVDGSMGQAEMGARRNQCVQSHGVVDVLCSWLVDQDAAWRCGSC